MSKVRLVNKLGMNEIIQQVVKVGAEYKIACYHPNAECRDRQPDSLGEKLCPYNNCKIRKSIS